MRTVSQVQPLALHVFVHMLFQKRFVDSKTLVSFDCRAISAISALYASEADAKICEKAKNNNPQLHRRLWLVVSWTVLLSVRVHVCECEPQFLWNKNDWKSNKRMANIRKPKFVVSNYIYC